MAISKTMWETLFPPETLVLSFLGRDTALVSSVAITPPDPKSPPPFSMVNLAAARPAGVEIALSTTSPTAGFVKAISAALPNDDKRARRDAAGADRSALRQAHVHRTERRVRQERHGDRRDRRARRRARRLHAAAAASSGSAGAALVGHAEAGSRESRVSGARIRGRVVCHADGRARRVSREQVGAGDHDRRPRSTLRCLLRSIRPGRRRRLAISLPGSRQGRRRRVHLQARRPTGRSRRTSCGPRPSCRARTWTPSCSSRCATSRRACARTSSRRSSRGSPTATS